MVSDNYLKYTNNISAQFFHYLLFYMKPDTVIQKGWSINFVTYK